MDALADSLPVSAWNVETPLEQEFEQLLADCPKLAFRVAVGVLRNQAEAEDVAQEAMLRAYRNFHRLRDRRRFRGWLVRTAWRLALDHLRASGRRERRELAALESRPPANAEDLAVSREFERHLAGAIEELPGKLRIVLILSGIKGHDTREVATLLSIPEGTVKSRLYLARKHLAEKLEWLANPTKTG